MSLAAPPCAAVESATLVLPAAIAAGTIACGQLAGLFVPLNTAASSATPTASESPA
jgi:hypothetical protein